jgi:hypothetical protein
VLVLTPRPQGAANVTLSYMASYAGVALAWSPSTVIPAGVDTVRVRVKSTVTAITRAYVYFISAQLPGLPPYTVVLTVNVIAPP